MKLAIIGAGPSGLEVLRQALNQNFDCVAFEQSGQVGGTWNYSESTDVDENGLPVHSSMYEELVTNVPKELMQFEDFPFDGPDRSFITQPEVLSYINNYVHHFNLLPYIKFNTQVIQVDVLQEEFKNGTIVVKDKWLIKTRDLHKNKINEEIFDAVCVCNGHFSDPCVPSLAGIDRWKDRYIHSHTFRHASGYKDKTVLVVGAGPSGVDIARKLVLVAKKVYLSYGRDPIFDINKPIISKPKVDYLTESEVVFLDGSKESVDTIVFCTGYNYAFPFLTSKCGITVKNGGWVRNLYKHVINIEHPTLAIINTTNLNSRYAVCGIQARFFLAFLNGRFHKTKEEMFEDLQKDREVRDKKGQDIKMAHALGVDFNGIYMDDLARTANIKGVPPVIDKILQDLFKNKFKKVNYRILNDEDFEKF